MKIVLSANTSWYLWNFRAGLITRFLECGYQVIVVCPEDETSKDLERLGCRVVTIRIQSKGKNVFFDLWIWLQYLQVFLKDKPSFYFGFTVKPVVYGSLAAQLVGIATIGTITGLGTAFIRPSWVTRVVKILYKVANKKMKRIFFQNQSDLNLFIDHNLVAPEKTTMVPGSGVNLERFVMKSTVEGRSLDAPIFLFVGRMLGDKGVQEFVDSAVIVRKIYPAAKFQMLGPTEIDNETAISLRKINKWVAEGVVEYLGSTSDVVPFIENADCVVLPSYREGIPRTLMEGAAMGRPLLAASSIGCVDVVDDKVTGLLFRPQDADDLAAKMIEFIRLPTGRRLQMGRAGRKKMEQEFDEKIVIDKYLSAVTENHN